MCHETVSYCKPDGDFRKVLVSPEIVTSQEFYRVVLSKDSYSSLLRVVDVVKAHCINIWGCSKQTTRVLVYFEGNFRRSFRICHAPRACQHKLITISTFLPSKGTLLFFAKPNLKKLIQNGCHQYSRQAVIPPNPTTPGAFADPYSKKSCLPDTQHGGSSRPARSMKWGYI